MSIYMMQYYSTIEKHNVTICNNMGRLGGHYTNWNKSNRERQMLYDVIYMWNLKRLQQINEYSKKVDLRDIENKLGITRGEREWGMEV